MRFSTDDQGQPAANPGWGKNEAGNGSAVGATGAGPQCGFCVGNMLVAIGVLFILGGVVAFGLIWRMEEGGE